MTNSLVSMRFGKGILLALVALLLASYALDCDAMAAPEQAMQCCGSMPCSSHGHDGQDCCKTMPTMHAPFVKPSTIQQGSFAVVVAVSPAVGYFFAALSAEPATAAVSHAPPIFFPPAVSPLRI